MKKNGFYGIGIEQGKNSFNYWTLFRTAQILDADFLFTIGKRFKPGAPDTMKAWRHVPVYSYDDFQDFQQHRPYSCRLIGIEMCEKAVNMNSFSHPKNCIYLLGAEDNGLSKDALGSCDGYIKLFGERSFNVSVAGSIVLYDRYQKRLYERE